MKEAIREQLRKLGVPNQDQTEDELQIQTANFLRFALRSDWLAWHVGNGEVRSKAAAGKLKAMGVLPGVPDWTFSGPDNFTGFIELKTRTGSQSQPQKDFQAHALATGKPYAIARSLDEFEAIARRWGALKG